MGISLQYRAPEEYDRDYINEQIDVFSFGNNIYGILTGLWVFYDVDDDETVQKNVIEGKRAYIDPRWRKRSFIESKLVDLMEKCWKAETDERIDIFGAVKELREIKKEHEMRNNFK
jgi:serine/threonine protein kinase